MSWCPLTLSIPLFKDKETQWKDFNFCPISTHKKRIEKKMKQAFWAWSSASSSRKWNDNMYLLQIAATNED